MADQEQQSLDSLPHYSDAIKMSKEEYYRYAKGVYEYRANCVSFMVESIEKFYEWCTAFNCLKSLDDCKIAPYPEHYMSTTSGHLMSSLAGHKTQQVTSSYHQLMKAVGYNGTCYDEFYCNQRYMAPYLHFILGIACLIMCLAGILTTSLFLPAFNVLSNRTGVTLYLTVMAVVDCLYMILFTLIIVIQYIPYEFTEQLDMYSRFTAYLIPYGLPSMQLMELLSVWITVAILVDRFLYLKFGFHSKIICSRKVSAKIVAAITLLLIIYTIPKYLEFHLIEYPKIGIMKVMYTTVGFNESFQNMLLHWLKVPVEMFLPYLADAIFSVINSIKFYDLMYKRKLSEASKDKQRNHHDLLRGNGVGGGGGGGDCCDITSPMMMAEGGEGGELEPDEKNAVKFPSLAIHSNIPLITSSLKDAEDRENDMVIVSLIIGFAMIALKIPKFVLHALKSEEYVDPKSTKFFQPINDFLDLSWVVAKPLVFFWIARHLRSALKSVFCCWAEFRHDGEPLIKVCPAVQMTEFANEYLRNTAARAASVSTGNHGCGGAASSSIPTTRDNSSVTVPEIESGTLSFAPCTNRDHGNNEVDDGIVIKLGDCEPDKESLLLKQDTESHIYPPPPPPPPPCC